MVVKEMMTFASAIITAHATVKRNSHRTTSFPDELFRRAVTTQLAMAQLSNWMLEFITVYDQTQDNGSQPAVDVETPSHSDDF